MFDRNELVSVKTIWGYLETAIVRDVLGSTRYKVLYSNDDFDIVYASDLRPMVYGPDPRGVDKMITRETKETWENGRHFLISTTFDGISGATIETRYEIDGVTKTRGEYMEEILY